MVYINLVASECRSYVESEQSAKNVMLRTRPECLVCTPTAGSRFQVLSRKPELISLLSDNTHDLRNHTIVARDDLQQTPVILRNV